jgi:hypothetical protein
MERQLKHHHSTSSTVVDDPGVSHDSGTTYTRLTATSSSSGRSQLPHGPDRTSISPSTSGDVTLGVTAGSRGALDG